MPLLSICDVVWLVAVSFIPSRVGSQFAQLSLSEGSSSGPCVVVLSGARVVRVPRRTSGLRLLL